MMNVALLNILQGLNTVFRPVDGQVGITRLSIGHGLQDSARSGKKRASCSSFCPSFFSGIHLLFLQPAGQLFKGQDSVDQAVIEPGLILFGDTGADKYRFGWIRTRTFSVSSVICFAFWGHTTKHWPHRMHSSTDVCLSCGKADGFYGAVANTFVAVLTVRFFQCQTLHLIQLLLSF